MTNTAATINYRKPARPNRVSLRQGEVVVLTGPRAGTVERPRINYRKKV